MVREGLATLHTSPVEDGQDALSVDIVAVHGLEGDQLGTWTDPQSGTLWLRDLLPFDILHSRVLAFGYNAEASMFFGDSSANRILQHAHTLVASLQADRALSNAEERPIIFVCHGLGGVLVKRALAYSATQTSSKVIHLYSVYVSTYGILFMGTPHNGLEHTAWQLIAHRTEASGGMPSDLLKSLTKNSETLQNITEQFAPLVKAFHIYFFWEGVKTTSGRTLDYVVRQDSAAPSWDNTERSSLGATHLNMCRFTSGESTDFKTVLAALLRYAHDAPRTIGPRHTSARRFLASQRWMEAQDLIGFDAHNNNELFICQSPKIKQNRKDQKFENEHFRVPHNVSSMFTGRDVVTQILRERILESNNFDAPRQQKRFVLYGLGGSGKTQFCLKFVSDYRDSFWAIFWIDASSVPNAERDLAEIGRLGGSDETCEAGIYWLASLEMPWLLVIDNADDPFVDYSRFFPAGNRGHILVTSRNSDCKIHATVGYYEFCEMDEEDAVTLLLKAAHHRGVNVKEVRDTARPIVRTLGHLALALIQAGASIRHGICSLEEYLEVFALHKKQILSDQLMQGADSYRYTIYTTWEVSVQRIESLASTEAVDAIQILQMMAFLHFEQVPANMFERAWDISYRADEVVPQRTWIARMAEFILSFAVFAYLYNVLLKIRIGSKQSRTPDILLQKGPQWDEYRFRSAMALLVQFSLISRDKKEEESREIKGYSMHPMVHFWARERLSKDEQETCSKNALATLADSITPELEPLSQPYRRSLLPHIDACLQYEHSQTFLAGSSGVAHVPKIVKFAAIYSECGMWTKAKDLQENILDLLRKSRGEDDPETLKAMTALAWTYWNLSLVNEAVELQWRVVEVNSEALGTQDVKTLKAMGNLANTYWLRGKRFEAQKLGEKAVEGLTQALGPGDPDTLAAMESLGRTYMHRSRLEDAQRLQMKVLENRQKTLSPSHPDTLMAMANLGMTHHAQGNLDDAEKALQAVVGARERVLGPEHAYTLWAINDLSKIYVSQDRADEAEELLDSIWQVVVRTLGKDHIGAWMTMMNFARAYNGQQKWNKARSILMDLIDKQMANLGAEHPDTLASMSELARSYKNMGRLDDAKEIFSKVIESMTESKNLGPKHPWTRKAIGQLSSIYISQGLLDEAEKLDHRLRQ